MSYTYLTTAQLAERIGYEERTVRNSLVGSVLIEGIHYIHPWGRRKMLFIWERIEPEMNEYSATRAPVIPMSNGNYVGG